MVLKNNNVVDIKEIIKDVDDIFAHTEGFLSDKESLIEHNNLCVKYLYKIIEDKNIKKILMNFENSFFKNSSAKAIDIWIKSLVNIVVFHDVGKINPYFQSKKMKNKKFNSCLEGDSSHSYLSGMIYMDYFYDYLIDLEPSEEDMLFHIFCIHSYIISRHHSNLEDLSKFLNKLDKNIEKFDKNKFSHLIKDIKKYPQELSIDDKSTRDRIEKKDNWICMDLYIYTRFIYSLVVAADFYATVEYKRGAEINDFGYIKNLNDYRESFDVTEINRNIRNQENCYGIVDASDVNDMNFLRNNIFLETEKNLLHNIDKNIFFLPAPTGSGKTNMSINLALRLLENDSSLNRISYNFPYNNLVEQVKESLQDVFKSNKNIVNNISVVNSVTPMKKYSKDGEEEEIDYEKTFLSRQFMHYPITISTNVSLFDALFNFNKTDLFPLVHMSNSVVILDEIQAYKNSIWKEMIMFLERYSVLLNIKFIIMSATLPNLSVLCHDEDNFVSLVKDSSGYFENNVFKDRVNIDYSLLEVNRDNVFNLILDKIEYNFSNKGFRGVKFVIEFIKKKSAREFFKFLKNNYSLNNDIEVLLFTGDDNLITRRKIINKLKKESDKSIILVATQTIEAGVDIDMDIGFKDISFLDSEEQFLGRINRNNKKRECKAYFFNYDDVGEIYKEDLRAQKKNSLLSQKMKDLLLNKDFDTYFSQVLDDLDMYSKKYNNKNIDTFRRNPLVDMEFKNIFKRLKLIDNDTVDVFVNRVIYDEKGTKYVGENIWNKYKEVLSNRTMNIAEKKYILSEVNSDMQYFIYRISLNKLSSIVGCIDSFFGGIYYIEDGDMFIESYMFD